MARPIPFGHLGVLLPAILLLFGACGCVSPERLSDQLLTSPNQRSTRPRIWQALNVPSSPFRDLKVPVRAPEANISVLIFPPGDYPGWNMSVLEQTEHFKLKMTLAASGWKFIRLGATQPERGTIFLLHGYSLFKEAMIPWAFSLARAGYRCVLVDLRGHGESTGQHFTFGKYEVQDLVQVLDWLEQDQISSRPVGVLGISFGATLAMHWAAQDERVESLVALAPFDDPILAAERYVRALRLPISKRTVRKTFQRLAAKLEMDWSEWAGSVAALESRKPILFIAGGKDPISPEIEIARMKAFAPEASRLIILPGVDHYQLGFEIPQLSAPVQAWFDSTLPPVDEMSGSESLKRLPPD